MAACLFLVGPIARADEPAADDLGAVVQEIEQHFASLADYKPGDLITQSQIKQALDRVQEAGMELPDANRLVKLGLADNSFLASQWSTVAGRKFMRKIARHQGAYARLDRLSSIPRGKTIVRDLIHQPQGDKFIEYLATTKSGRNLGGMLSDVPGGADLNKPTGRIYTAEDLIAELNREYARTRIRSTDFSPSVN